MRKIILISELMEYLSGELDNVRSNGMGEKSTDYIEGYNDALEFFLRLVRNRW